MTDFDIRSFEQRDANRVYDIIGHYRDGGLDSYPFPVDRFTDPDDVTAFARVAVDTETDQAVGVLALYLFDTIADVREKLSGDPIPSIETLSPSVDCERYGYIASGYVHPDYLRQGLGQRLLSEIESVGRDCGVGAFFTELWGHDEEKDARRLFDKAGYEEVFSEPQYWGSGGSDSSTACPRCSGSCTCLGAIYRRVEAAGEEVRVASPVANH